MGYDYETQLIDMPSIPGCLKDLFEVSQDLGPLYGIIAELIVY